MAAKQPGDTVQYTVTYLEMDARPTAPVPPMPVGPSLALLAAIDPPPEYFLYLYTGVGAAYEWTDWLNRPRSELEAYLGDGKVELFSLLLDGWPAGFFVLDSRNEGVCDLAYFGLMPQATGRGLARWFLGSAVHMGWSRPAVTRMTVNTNTLDHPRALALYQKIGFRPVRRENHSRVLTRPHGG